MKFRLKKDLKKGDLIDTNLGSDVCEEVKGGRWKPEHGDWYYAVGAVGGVFHWGWEDNEDDRGAYSIGNVFRTKEEAEKALARQKAIVELEDLCDWEEGIAYCIFYDQDAELFDWSTRESTVLAPWRFATEESVRHAIETLGEQKLKLIFRIET